MQKRFVQVAVAALVALAPVVGLASAPVAHAATGDEVCPFVPGMPDIDPDFVRFEGPSTIPVGHTTTVRILASESPDEVAANSTNEVTLTVVAVGSDHSTFSFTASSPQAAAVDVPLPGTPGVTYTINWVVVFDYALHPCASIEPGHRPFTVRVG